jgi:hypothetical protein
MISGVDSTGYNAVNQMPDAQAQSMAVANTTNTSTASTTQASAAATSTATTSAALASAMSSAANTTNIFNQVALPESYQQQQTMIMQMLTMISTLLQNLMMLY